MIDPITVESILNNLPGHIYWKDKNGIYLGCNHQQALSFGRSHVSEIIGKTDFDYLPYSEAQMIWENDQKVMRAGEAQVLEETVTFRGELVTVVSHKVPLKNPEGESIGLVGMSINIMEQKEYEKLLYQGRIDAEAQNKLTESYLSNIVTNLPGHVFWEDENGVILGCNDAQAQSVGLEKAEDLIGKSVYYIEEVCGWDKGQVQAVRENDLMVMQTGESISVEENIIWADGKPRTVISNKAPLLDDEGKCAGILGIAFDITERKRIEKELLQAKKEAEQANRAKMEFIANISHDLRTPLHALISTAELLKLKKHLPEQEEYIDSIFQSAKTLLRLIENVLDFAKIEEEKLVVKFETFNLKDLMSEIITSVKQEVEKQGLEIYFHYPQGPEFVISDANHLARILINLLGNALKFTAAGRISLIVELVQQTESHITFNIIVQDTGIGIPASELNNIFERFHRLESAYKGKYHGTGLGLAITKKLIDNLKGTIQVQSTVNQGTRFICTLPFEIASQPSQFALTQEHSAEIDLALIHSRKLNLLLVEDTPIIQRITKDLLVQFGCEVAIAENGTQALKMAHDDYDLILMDIGLPDCDGLTVIQNIHKNIPGFNTPIIALTAHASDEIKIQCLNAGAIDYLAKPISYKSLIKAINKYVKPETNLSAL